MCWLYVDRSMGMLDIAASTGGCFPYISHTISINSVIFCLALHIFWIVVVVALSVQMWCAQIIHYACGIYAHMCVIGLRNDSNGKNVWIKWLFRVFFSSSLCCVYGGFVLFFPYIYQRSRRQTNQQHFYSWTFVPKGLRRISRENSRWSKNRT